MGCLGRDPLLSQWSCARWTCCSTCPPSTITSPPPQSDPFGSGTRDTVNEFADVVLPPPPPADSDLATKVSFKMPQGSAEQNLTRHFCKTDPVSVMFKFIQDQVNKLMAALHSHTHSAECCRLCVLYARLRACVQERHSSHHDFIQVGDVRRFDLRGGFPQRSLRHFIQESKSVVNADLCNSRVTVHWLES